MYHQIQTAPSRQRSSRAFLAVAAAALLYFSGASPSILIGDALSTPSSIFSSEGADIVSNNNRQDDLLFRRNLSVSLGSGGCVVTYPHLSPTPIKPTWQASFPGSGARMTFNLIQALTGIRTSDDYNSHNFGFENVVAVKTHYPVKSSRHNFPNLDPLFDRAIVILRNPMNAIPSYFNLLYEHEHHLPNHSTRGPNSEWIKYSKDAGHGLPYQLPKFEEFIEYWMERYLDRESQILLLSYEDLTDDIYGANVAAQINNFLAEQDGVDPIEAEAVPCVWDTIVNYNKHTVGTKNVVTQPVIEVDVADRRAAARNIREEKVTKQHNQNNGRRMLGVNIREGRTHAVPVSLRVGPKVRPYTEQQLGDILGMLHRLVEKYRYDEDSVSMDLVRILNSYIEVVENTVPTPDNEIVE